MHIILLLPELKSECDNIIVGLKSGSFDAFEKVYKLYSGKLYNFVMRISGGDSYWAEEIVQRTFVRLWEIHDQVSSDKSLISYLCTIAKNLLMNVYQRQTVEYIYAEYVLESSEEYSDNADGELDGKLLEEYIDRLAEELPPSRKKIFVLSKRKHFTNKEIAVELNISESTVATQLSLALKFMRDKLMAHYDELLPLVIYATLIKIV